MVPAGVEVGGSLHNLSLNLAPDHTVVVQAVGSSWPSGKAVVYDGTSYMYIIYFLATNCKLLSN